MPKAQLRAENWTKGWLARDSDGRRVHPLHDSAKRWCLLGFIYRFTPEAEVDSEITRVANAIQKLFPTRCVLESTPIGVVVHSFNDHPSTSIEDVIRVFTDCGHEVSQTFEDVLDLCKRADV